MVQRRINNVDVLINPYSANEIYFNSKFLEKNGSLVKSMSPSQLCGLISGCSYTPMLLTWELLDRCNFYCPFCYIVGHSHNEQVRFENIKSKIQELIDLGLLYCTLTGGEILLHKDFKEIYSFLKLSGVLVALYSNGYLIDNEIINLFKQLPPYKIEISIYGVDQKNFDKVTGTKGRDYQKVLDNILKLRDLGIKVKCKTPFNSITEDGFSKIGDWCNLNGIDYYYSTTIFQAYDGKNLNHFQSNFSSMISCEANKIQITDKSYPEIFDCEKQNTIKKCYTCGIKNYGLHINSNFELLPCQRTQIKECNYRIVDLGIKKSINLNRQFVNTYINKPIRGCTGCEASNTCKMCPAIAVPVYNNGNQIEAFSVPLGYCDFERERSYKLTITYYPLK
ncbi:radical SAM protein [Odoribacter laneus]|uniref:radical SAM protein n=1 Tax=Odoribacter laneus TaxID=626933 RepID=UPI003AADEE28